jgi:hypothetical protein
VREFVTSAGFRAAAEAHLRQRARSLGVPASKLEEAHRLLADWLDPVLAGGEGGAGR